MTLLFIENNYKFIAISFLFRDHSLQEPTYNLELLKLARPLLKSYDKPLYLNLNKLLFFQMLGFR